MLLVVGLVLWLDGVVVSVPHARIAQVVNGWVDMAKLAGPFIQYWGWGHSGWQHGWRWTWGASAVQHLCLQVSHGLHTRHSGGREGVWALWGRLKVGRGECLGMLGVRVGLGEELRWWRHLGEGHYGWILKLSIGGSKVGWRQKRKIGVLGVLRMLRVGDHLLGLHVHVRHWRGRLWVALLHGDHWRGVCLYS